MSWIHPEFAPAGKTFTSSEASSPFSVSQSAPDDGSNVIPNVLRMPYA